MLKINKQNIFFQNVSKKKKRPITKKKLQKLEIFDNKKKNVIT